MNQLKKIFFFFLVIVYATHIHAQSVNEAFNISFKKLLQDDQFKHATISLYVKNTTTGQPVTEMNTNIGVAPASCQKVITACTAFELLGHDYSYKTTLGYTGEVVNGVLNGDIIIKGSGDPTLGSWRYQQTTEENIISAFIKAIQREGIHEITGHVYADESLWKGEVTPGGWIWEDIGNYYGAGARAINWRENQYDVFLKSGKNIGDTVEVVGTKPSFVQGLNFKSMATSAARGSGDKSYIYLPLNDPFSYIRGTIPINESSFSVSGSMPHPATQLALTLEAALKHVSIEKTEATYPVQLNLQKSKTFYTYTSPVLDSIIFYFLRRSVNLYGESLIKTLAYNITNVGATDSGVNVIKKFWKNKGIDPSAINIIDGSGLSPANRVTTQALVTVMEYARKQSWFSSFYNALPTISGIKMKSGSIGGVISYTGYIKGKNNDQYTFSFVINNYDGNDNEVRRKMWKLLREL
jgi:D-alanyl-D-alanine carboxypeptidase/D-alanyl-D-alanine-endopeptidase (penicillin-binding protein 4)